MSRNLRRWVEIGVFGGRSLIPPAAALQQSSEAIYGNETWRTDIATEPATNQVNDDWWKKVDLNGSSLGFYDS
ncbi:hypothetical protein ACI3KW_00070 [Devosia sp. ZW T5_3]|uniref:hypothetical protein n=1 Tax=Devosia sp. ZW T5_3 TaxID=3378085 RepID=UPI003853C96A